MEELKKLASEGNPLAQFNLGRTYYVLSEGIKAFHWWAKSVRQGNADAMFRVAEFLRTPESRLAAYIKAAQCGSMQAQWFLGNIYKYSGELYNVNLEADEGRALFWYRKAAKQNYPSAFWALAVHYRSKGNLEKSNHYFDKAHSSLQDKHDDLCRKYLLATGKSANEK